VGLCHLTRGLRRGSCLPGARSSRAFPFVSRWGSAVSGLCGDRRALVFRGWVPSVSLSSRSIWHRVANTSSIHCAVWRNVAHSALWWLGAGVVRLGPCGLPTMRRHPLRAPHAPANVFVPNSRERSPWGTRQPPRRVGHRGRTAFSNFVPVRLCV